jgi:hypothetical protein
MRNQRTGSLRKFLSMGQNWTFLPLLLSKLFFKAQTDFSFQSIFINYLLKETKRKKKLFMILP